MSPTVVAHSESGYFIAHNNTTTTRTRLSWGSPKFYHKNHRKQNKIQKTYRHFLYYIFYFIHHVGFFGQHKNKTTSTSSSQCLTCEDNIEMRNLSVIYYKRSTKFTFKTLTERILYLDNTEKRRESKNSTNVNSYNQSMVTDIFVSQGGTHWKILKSEQQGWKFLIVQARPKNDLNKSITSNHNDTLYIYSTSTCSKHLVD